ncbi:hypothetical protein L195_g048948, partial [Trifolium pratense]
RIEDDTGVYEFKKVDIRVDSSVVAHILSIDDMGCGGLVLD